MWNSLNQNAKGMNSDHQLYTLRVLRPSNGPRILAWCLMGILFLLFLVLFLPWQQNIRGSGSVTALDQQNRPQQVQAVIAGRIEKWFVREGQSVSKGDTIATISEVKEKYFDPALLLRLREQITAKESAIESKQQKADALLRQQKAMQDGLRLKVEQLNAKLEAEKVKFKNAQNQYERNKKLFEAGNITLTKFQDIEYKFQGSQADLLNTQTEVNRTRAEYMDKISKTESEISNTYSELFEAEGEVSKLRNEYANVEIRSRQYQIIAPQSGTVVKALTTGLGETVKEGDPVCTILPDAGDIAIEMFVRAMDVPLLSKGRQVRVEFDGWPALQFSGWPSVSVGTFGGKVAVIDNVNTRPGEFRILVVPDPGDEPWPKQLRIGSGTKGWIMLEDVPVWYEVWRQLNGFPPSLYQKDSDSPIIVSKDAASEGKENADKK